MTGAPAAATRALSVAAIDGSLQNYPGASMALSTGDTITAQDSNGAPFADGTSLPVKVLRNSDGSVSLGCDPAAYTAAGVTGKLVVVKRGTCARVAKAIYGQKAGAAAVAMVNTNGGLPPFEGDIRSNPDTGEQYTVTIPFFGVKGCLGTSCADGSTDTADGDNLVAADGGTVTLTNALIPNTGYSRLASFSSGGPRNVDSVQKPEITAPGVSVVSVGIGTGTGAATISGTSMASPMTAGVAALAVQGHPTWDVEAIKAALINTADRNKVLSYNPRNAGSGVVDASKAVDTVAYATTSTAGLDTLAYGYESLHGAYSETLPVTLHNSSDTAIQYTMSANPASTVFGQTMTFTPSTVTVPAHGTASVDVKLELDASHVAGLPSLDATNWWLPGGLQTIRGAVLATPQGDPTAGVYTLRIPFMLAPRGESNVTAGNRSSYTKGSNSTTVNATVPLSNNGIHAGTADIYSWGISDAADTPGAEGGMDVRTVGVQVFPGQDWGLSANDRMMVFAINVNGRASTPAANEFDVAIDLQNDGKPDYFVVGVDFGAVTTGDFDGRFASIIFDKNGNVIDAWAGTNDLNGSILELPVPASEIGLAPGANAPAGSPIQGSPFRYWVNAFSIVPGDLVDTTPLGWFRAFQPPVSTGDYIGLDPGQNATLHVSVDKDKLAGAPVKGWMVVSTDDPNGTAQADTVPIGNP
jgi:hypothetical protein